MKNYSENIKQMYKRALIGADILLWEWNIEKCCVFFSDNFKNIVENSIENFKSLFDFIDKIVIDEDKISARNDLIFFMKGNSKIYRSEFKILTKKNITRLLLIKGNATKDSTGKIILLSGFINDITQKKKLEEYITYSAYHDSLTKLPNRISFINDLKSILDTDKKGALIFIDIDNFKLINDTFGHDYGDLLLIIFSQLITLYIEPYGTSYRLGGDEFMFLINNINSHDKLKELCMQINKYLRTPFEIKGKQVYITVSIGIALFPDDGNTARELYKYTDLALFKSKHTGKNSVTFFKQELFYSYQRKLIIEQELKTAIENNELHILYQPQIDAVKNQIIGFESLLRWNNNKLGFISPKEFIPICESTGSIVEIGEWVLTSVCKMIYRLQIKGYKFETISINVSPIQLKNNNFVAKFINIYERNGISPSLLEIEITEGTLIDLYTCKVNTLDELIKKGIRVALDDFGTGYSSLNYLTILPVNTLKIDKSFIDNIESKKNNAVIRSIIDLSKTLNYKIIAEGVETKKQLDLLLDIGCNIIQGYYFSKPLPMNKVEDILTKKNKFGGS